MDVEKQREIIRLWNRMRRVEGPIAEEIRIQILEYFAAAGAHQARGLNRTPASLKHAAQWRLRKRSAVRGP